MAWCKVNDNILMAAQKPKSDSLLFTSDDKIYFTFNYDTNHIFRTEFV